MQTNSCDEIEVEMAPAEDRYPEGAGGPVDEAEDALFYGMCPDEFEVARGLPTQSYGLDSYLPEGPNIQLRDDTESEDTAVRKIKVFIKTMETDPVWVRSLTQVGLATTNNPYLKENLLKVVSFCVQNVNNRPRYMIIKTKTIGMQDIQEIVKAAFAQEDKEVALNNSLCRVYCKNAANSLKELTRLLITTCREIPNLRISYNDIFAEYKPSKSVSIRLKTRDFNSFLELEEHARHMNLEYNTTLSIKRRTDPSREIAISWYDKRVEGGKASYIYLDHAASRPTTGRVSFDRVSCEEYQVPPGDKFVPWALANPAVQDLITFLDKTSVGRSSL